MSPELPSTVLREQMSAIGQIINQNAFGAYGALDLAMRRLAAERLAVARAVIEFDRYLSLAAHLGVDRDVAERCVLVAQPRWRHGEPPTSEDLALAEALVRCVPALTTSESAVETERQRVWRRGLSQRLTEAFARCGRRPVRSCGCPRGR
ncbi:hypothetical protein [Streptomyces sp. NPDC005385]|uniref:hypothetical protein n=1 Tax=Streptomyces sp. NPDC005385 TaxID=3157039 RepID=UPI0033B4619B